MKFLVINTDYPAFLTWLYAQYPELYVRPYAEQMQVRAASLFGFADFYSSHLIKLGHEAHDLFINNAFMQKIWAVEHGVSLGPDRELRFFLRKGFIPWYGRVSNFEWIQTILAAQIRYFKPDVLVNFAMNGVSTSFLESMKPYFSLLVGSGEPPILYEKDNWKIYDLVLAPSEGMTAHFRDKGVHAELFRFSFEPQTHMALDHHFSEEFPVSFVGSITKYHSKRYAVLQHLCSRLGEKIGIWAPTLNEIDNASPIHAAYKGAAWGSSLYQILLNSKLTINCHIDAAGEFADNMRLFEATGMGTLLITDYKQNLHTLFDIDKEIITYHNSMECVEKILYYLEHETERSAIAKAGQSRTFKEHTYDHRARELVDIVKKYL
ncbi:MAG: glycosyltransferase family 1 protein [Desulfobacteraceae bacterium]|nr:MAG: glycosyltransferase family 1 protein [Desulfobacteraceae bacterium]